jgi:hypothetical protein
LGFPRSRGGIDPEGVGPAGFDLGSPEERRHVEVAERDGLGLLLGSQLLHGELQAVELKIVDLARLKPDADAPVFDGRGIDLLGLVQAQRDVYRPFAMAIRVDAVAGEAVWFAELRPTLLAKYDELKGSPC